MAVFTILSLTAIRYVAGGAMRAVGLSDDDAGVLDQSQKVVHALLGHFTDHSQRLTKALTTANERSWKTLEVALAGDSFWDRCKTALSSGEDQALAQQVRGFLDRAILAEQPDRGRDFRQGCLAELCAARKAGVLGGSLDRASLEREAGSFARYADPLALLDADWRGVEQVADELQRANYPRLGQLLRLRTGQKLPLLVIAARYYFRRAVEQDGELARGLNFAKLEALSDSQEQGFRQVGEMLERQSARLEELLAGVQAVVVETHGGVLRLEEEMRRQGEEVQGYYRQFIERLDRLDMKDRNEMRASDGCSIRSEDEKEKVRQFLRQYRAMSESERRQRPALLNAVAKLEFAAGDFQPAQEDFQNLPALVQDKNDQAEAHHNAYRAALEKAGKSKKKEDWEVALTELIKAFNRNRKYLPFDARKYHPQRILGAGGFGVTFLCKRRGPGDLVAVKSLASENLDRDTEKVLDEGRLLGSLDHPAIIRMIDCDYADPDLAAGPFLVMEFFDGPTLEEYVRPEKPVAVDEAVTMFRLVAEGLKAAHARGVLHRDIKPANLLLRREADAWRVKVIDFGLALRRELTQAGMMASTSRQSKSLMGESIAGTLHYAAPEQMDAERQKEIGPWSDVYGFGKTCYYALFGNPTPDDDEKDGLPDGLKRLLSRCTSQAVAKRPPSFTEVVERLKEIERSLVPAIEEVEAVEELAVVAEEQWYYSQSGNQAGPVPEAGLRRLIEGGQVRETDLVWKQGFTAWLPVEAVKPLASLLPRRSVAQVRIIGEGEGWQGAASVRRFFDGAPGMLKVKVDGRLVGESSIGSGFDYLVEVPPGKHVLEIAAWGKWMEGSFWSQKHLEGEMDRKQFELVLDQPRQYEIKVNVALTGRDTMNIGRPSLQNSTVDILS